MSLLKVYLSQTELRLIEGDTGALTATVEPDNATNQNVTWSSDNPNVATVNNGVVTAVAAGTATITITTEDGDKTSTCAVTVVHGSLTHTPGNAATCTAEGNGEYWTCETCGKHFSDAGANTEITLAQTVIPATGHGYENGRCRVCNTPEPGFNPAIIDEAGDDTPSPQTNDNNHIALWIVLLLISGAGLSVTVLYHRK